jgi:thiol-disulfide isomerase/thioredoxin
MKKLTFNLLLLINLSVCNAQNQGSITTKEIKPRAGIENHYIYQPPKNLLIPDKIQALVIYQNNQQFFSKTIRIDKAGNNYGFSFKAPDYTSVLIFSIIVPGKVIPEKSSLVMEKKTLFDNNNENGFIIYLHDKTGKRFANEQIDLAGLMDDYAVYQSGLKEKSTPSLIKMYEESYRLHPELKKENTYVDYLLLLYKKNENTAKPKLLSYAKQLLQIKNDEDKWANAASIYSELKMTDEKKRVQDEILIAFPNGKRANGYYWNNFYAKPDTTEEAMLATMNIYMARFNDNTAKTKDRFYRSFIATFITHKDWATALKYGDLLNDKIQAAYQYNYDAWKLSGKQIDNPGIDLENAKILSAKSIAISTMLMNDGADRDEDALRDLKEAHFKFYDTYALILYKLGQYDSAFYYQDLVSKQGKELNTGGMERYAAYAEKVKGTSFTKDFIESKLLTGTKSPVMLKQLQGIYKQLNLPEDEFSRLQQISMLLAKQKNDAAIIAEYGTLQAPDFSLKNMAGETVTLSGLKNKIVILDFWATWCGPCKASFPTMQQLINKYKDDKDVVFLFIDTWENEVFQKTQEAVTKYMADNKYSFNVLFDVKKKVVKDYKIEEIPKKIILDMNANLVYTGGQSGLIFTEENVIDEMTAHIDAAKKIPFNPNINNTKLPNPVFLHPKTKQ